MRVLGLLIATGGGVAIGFGWAGAAQEGCVDCQIPYLLSGGAAGIGLIIFGIALLLLAQIRTESRRLGDRIEHALGIRIRPAEGPAARRPEREPAKLGETKDAPSVGEPRAEAAAPAATAPAEPRPEEAAVASAAPTPNPLAAVPVDAPASERDAEPSDAATVAATTMAGGVVDTETARTETAGEEPSDSGGAEGDRTGVTEAPSEDVSRPPSPADQAQEILGRRSASTRRRVLFWRRQGS